MLSFLPTRKFVYRHPFQIRWVLLILPLQIYFCLFFLQLMLNWWKFYLQDVKSCLFGGAPSCFFTFDNQTKQTWRPVYGSLPFFPSSVLPPLWSAGQTRLDSWVWGLFWGFSCLPCCVALLKSLRQRVSHSAAALCVCIPDSRFGTYCVVLVFAFEKAATVSLVVVQQWVRVSVCVCVCLWMQDSGKSSVHLTELFSLLLNFILLWVCLVAL